MHNPGAGGARRHRPVWGGEVGRVFTTARGRWRKKMFRNKVDAFMFYAALSAARAKGQLVVAADLATATGLAGLRAAIPPPWNRRCMRRWRIGARG